MITLLFFLLIIFFCAYFIKRALNKKSEIFLKQGIPFKKPFSNLNFTQSALELFAEMYYFFPDAKIVGLFEFMSPFYLVRDPEIIKQLTIKDFDHFTDRRTLESETLFSKSLSLLTGQKWKDMRATLSPAFTGNKMRQMLELIDECSQEFVNYFLENKNDRKSVDMEETFTRFTSDVIATCAFGLKINSLKDRNNEFFKMGSELLNPNQTKFMLKAIFLIACPKLAKFFKVTLFDIALDRFFRSLIVDTMAVREKENIFRPDMIHLLMQIRKDKLNDDGDKEQDILSAVSGLQEKIKDGKIRGDWSEDELVAQCLLFFIAGFLTTSTALSTLSYELAVNPEVQERLIEEIDEVYDKNNGKLTYESLQSMKYMTMVVSESLRKWPPLVFIERICVKNLNLDDPSGFNVTFEKGRHFYVPVQAMHHDPKYYPDPEKFDPERFNEVNIKNIVPFTYLPFGGGPRSCIASRFALMQVKSIVFYLLKNFKLKVTEKTQIPLKLGGPFLKAEKGVFLELENRLCEK